MEAAGTTEGAYMGEVVGRSGYLSWQEEGRFPTELGELCSAFPAWGFGLSSWSPCR